MRVGDCSLEVVPVGGGGVRELPSGHVLARPGQVYLLRLRNHGPLRGVAEVRVDGRRVSAGGLVLDPGATVELERPIHATERGRFTVVSEGDEAVFGPDGGRDNAALGLIEVRFRRELPRGDDGPSRRFLLRTPLPDLPRPLPPAPGAPPPMPPRWPATPPEWSPPSAALASPASAPRPSQARIVRSAAASPPEPMLADVEDALLAPRDGTALPAGAVERAAGTGLTGRSDQEFRPVQVGELEPEATVLRLRLVIGNPNAIEAPRPLPDDADVAPARPAARP